MGFAIDGGGWVVGVADVARQGCGEAVLVRRDVPLAVGDRTVSASEQASDPRVYRDGETVVLGVDPSMTATGYAVVSDGALVAAGTIPTSPDESEPERVWIIFRELVAIIEEYDVDHVAVEEFTAFYVSSSRRKQRRSGDGSPLSRLQSERSGRHDRAQPNPRSMFLMKAAQTASQMAAVVTRRPLFLYPVSEWKGGPRVSKQAVMAKAHTLYGVETRNDNITDAIMIAHHHATAGSVRPERGLLPAGVEEIMDTWPAADASATDV